MGGLVITTLHRRSCTILGREPVRNPDTMRKLKNFLDQRLITGDAPFSDDFDIIDHRNCDYDSTQGLALDPDAVLGGDVQAGRPKGVPAYDYDELPFGLEIEK